MQILKVQNMWDGLCKNKVIIAYFFKREHFSLFKINKMIAQFTQRSVVKIPAISHYFQVNVLDRQQNNKTSFHKKKKKKILLNQSYNLIVFNL